MTGNDVIAYHQGELSYRFDKTATCPYSHPSSEWDYWHQGWYVGMKYDKPEWNDFKGFELINCAKKNSWQLQYEERMGYFSV